MFVKRIANKTLKIIDSIFWTDYQIKLQNHFMGFHNSSYQFEKSQVAFVHIPKTGGTSLHNLLSQNKQQKFIGLNMHRPISRLCKPSEYNYVTVMRNPIDRVWSYYQMVLRNPPGFPYKRFANNGLECFLNHCWESQNMACRYYSGEVKRTMNTQMLNIALNNLENFIYVIDFDNFQDEATKFLTKYNISMPSIPHERKSYYNSCSQKKKDLIYKYNTYDMEIFYKWKEFSKNQHNKFANE